MNRFLDRLPEDDLPRPGLNIRFKCKVCGGKDVLMGQCEACLNEQWRKAIAEKAAK